MVSLQNVSCTLFFLIISSQMRVRRPTQRERKADRRTRRKTERRREKERGVAPPPPPQRITSSSSLTALTPVGHWGSPCTGMFGFDSLCAVQICVVMKICGAFRNTINTPFISPQASFLKHQIMSSNTATWRVKAVTLLHSFSHYSSALSQPGDIPAMSPTDLETTSPDHSASGSPEGELAEAEGTAMPPGAGVSGTSSANDMLCTSQTLDDEPLTPEVVAPPKAIFTPRLVRRVEYKHSNLNILSLHLQAFIFKKMLSYLEVTLI